MKTITVQGIKVSYDIDQLVAEANSIEYERSNFVNWDDSEDGEELLHESAPTEEEFINLRTKFANEISTIEELLPQLIEENLFLTKAGVLAKSRRRPLLMGHDDFYTNIVDEYDHDHQFDRPYLKMERTGDKEAELIIHSMQTDY